MQPTPLTTTEFPPGRGGGRAASDLYRQSIDRCDGFAGLDENVHRYDLLLLVKRAGKAAGFSPRMTQLLDYYMAFTRDVDWEEGGRPIVYQSLSRTALDMGVSERQIQKLEKQLFEVGATTWNDSGNHKRFGQRDARTGRIRYAYGVDLTPLAHLRAELEAKLHEKQLYEQAWMETKRRVSWYRRQIRSLLIEAGASAGLGPHERSYQAIAGQIRTHMDLASLRALLRRHKDLHAVLLAETTATERAGEGGSAIAEAGAATTKGSCQSEPGFAHSEPTTQQSLDKSSSGSPQDGCLPGRAHGDAAARAGSAVVAPPSSAADSKARGDVVGGTGIRHLRLRPVLQAASGRFRDHLPLSPDPIAWRDVVDAADRLRAAWPIPQATWGEACGLLGRTGAAVGVLVTDQAMLRRDNPVRNPAAYFQSLLSQARRGELRLHRSVYGLLERKRLLAPDGGPAMLSTDCGEPVLQDGSARPPKLDNTTPKLYS